MAKEMISIRIDEMVLGELGVLHEESGLTKTALIQMAVDKLYRDFYSKKMQKKDSDRIDHATNMLWNLGKEYIENLHDYESTYWIGGKI